MDRVLPSEGRGCWFDPSRAHHAQALQMKMAAKLASHGLRRRPPQQELSQLVAQIVERERDGAHLNVPSFIGEAAAGAYTAT